MTLGSAGLTARATAHFGRPRGLRRFEVQFKRVSQISQSFRFALALAGDVELQALRDVPLALPPNRRSEWSLHVLMVSPEGVLVAVIRAVPGC